MVTIIFNRTCPNSKLCAGEYKPGEYCFCLKQFWQVSFMVCGWYVKNLESFVASRKHQRGQSRNKSSLLRNHFRIRGPFRTSHHLIFCYGFLVSIHCLDFKSQGIIIRQVSFRMGKSSSTQSFGCLDHWVLLPHRKSVQWRDDHSPQRGKKTKPKENRTNPNMWKPGNLKTAAFCTWCSKEVFGNYRKGFHWL